MASARPVHFEVKLTNNSGQWLGRQLLRANRALGVMAEQIKSTATITIPKKSGALQNSGRTVKSNGEVAVIFGGGRVPYGGYQERGMRADGSHIVRQYTTAGTGAHYLETAGRNVSKKGIAWLLSRS